MINASTYAQIAKRHWPEGMPLSLDVPNESLWHGFARRAEEAPDAVGIDFLGKSYTWRQLVNEANHLAGALQQLGLAKGDRVLLFTQNCPQYVIAFHAVLRAGAVLVPVNPMNKAAELEHYIADAQAHFAICSSDIANEMAKASAALSNGLQHLVVFDLADALPEDKAVQAQWPELWQQWLPQRHPLPQQGGQVHSWTDLLSQQLAPTNVSLNGTDLALLPYTSGTTGAAKGCMHSHRSLLHNALSSAPWLDMSQGDRQLIVVPMFHITGLVMGMLSCIRHRCQLVILPRWDRRMAARAISQHRITHWPNIPTMVIDLLSGDDLDQYDLSSLRYIGGGGAPMPDAVALKLKTTYGLDYIEGYGLTESSAPTHCNHRSAPKRHCLGIPYLSTQALIIDPETLTPMPVGEVGEIVVNGPQLFQGYWQQPKATADAFVTVEGVTYFRTGDMGRMDDEGYYFLADRLKRMINASGFKVWPAEVEGLLHRHPAIKEACVISTKDAYRGETVKALVVLHASQQGQVRPEAIIDWAKANMAAYKYPRIVELVTELPRTATGKVLWRHAQAEQDQRDAAAKK